MSLIELGKTLSRSENSYSKLSVVIIPECVYRDLVPEHKEVVCLFSKKLTIIPVIGQSD